MKVLGIRKQDDVDQVLVQWLGFTTEEATWEPLDPILQDIPDLIREYHEAN